jgi:hypothetical protein
MRFDSQLVRLRSRVERAMGIAFPGSGSYWDRRYRAGGTSGCGSYGRLARYKAEYLNRFVATNGVLSVIEHGCGDGNQLSLADYPVYFGVDISPAAVSLCQTRFHKDQSKRFGTRRPNSEKFDLSLSLDVIYHLIENRVFELYMSELFAVSARWVIIYASDLEQDEFLQEHPGYSPIHVRHRCISDWVANHYYDWELVERSTNPYAFDISDPDNTSFSDFLVYRRQ